MFSLFEGKPDHPLFDLAEAKRLIAELPQDNHRKALEDITFWLESIKDVPKFHPEVRAAIVLLLDETALPLHTELLQQYLEVPHVQDFSGLHQWQYIHAFAKAQTEAYAASIEEYPATQKKSPEHKQQLPLLCVRWARAIAGQMKLELMRYLDVEAGLWRQLADYQRFIETEQIAETMLLAYPGTAMHTNPQRELLRVLLLNVAAPDMLAPDQIEVCYRISGRMCGFFDMKAEAHADCPWCFDVSSGAVSRYAEGKAAPDLRYFGAVRALPALLKIEKQNEEDPVWQERRFGSEFTPAGKLTVLKHLMQWWSNQLPARHPEHHGIDATVDIVHGFRLISQLITRIELAGDDAENAKKQGAIGLEEDEQIEFVPETWNVTDLSADEIGISLPKTGGTWVKIGDLCGIKPRNGNQWWVGAIRRIHTDADNTVHVAIGLLAKKPLSLWLRALGKGAEMASNWESSSGSFEYSYLPVILLPDAHNSYLRATMLMETAGFVPGNYYQAMMGEKSRDLKLTNLINEGEDYEQVGFEWVS